MNDLDIMIAKIYDSALEPATFLGMLTDLNRWLDSVFFHYLGYDGASLSSNFSYISEPEFHPLTDKYSQHYGVLDPRREFVHTTAPGSLMVCSELFSDAEVSRLEVFQDFLLKENIRYTMGTCVRRKGTSDSYIVFNKMKGQGGFSEEQKMRLRMVIPHLIHSIALMEKNSKLLQAAGAVESAVLSMNQGVAVLTKNDNIIFSNAILETWQQNGLLHLSGKKIRFNPIASQQAFLAALRQVRSSRIPRSLLLNCGSDLANCSKLIIQIAPAVSNNFHKLLLTGNDSSWLALESIGHFNGKADLVVQLSVAQQGATPSERQLVQLFGLTKAECRLSIRLAEGLTLGEYAELQGVSMATIRTQMRSLLQKAGVMRQQDLIRLFCQISTSQLPHDVGLDM